MDWLPTGLTIPCSLFIIIQLAELLFSPLKIMEQHLVKMDKRIAIKAVDEALKLDGYVEKSENWDENIKKYLASCFINYPAPYCIAFVKFRLIRAAEDLNLELSDEFMKLDAWTPNWKNYALKHDIFIPVGEARLNHNLIKKGYIILFHSDIKERIYHGGLVVSSTKEGVWTIEANTSNHAAGSLENGEGIFKKFRRWSALGRAGGFLKTY